MVPDKTTEEIVANAKQQLKDSPTEIVTFEMEFQIDKTKTEIFVAILHERLEKTFDAEGIKFLWVAKNE